MFRAQQTVAFPSVFPRHLKPAMGAHEGDFLSLHDITISEMGPLLSLAEEVKAHPEAFMIALQGRMPATEVRSRQRSKRVPGDRE